MTRHAPKKKRRGGIRVTALDALASKAVKARDKRTCQRCGKQYPEKAQGLHAAHIFTRARKKTRYDTQNLITLCYGCHSFFHREPLLFHTWAEEKLGAFQYWRVKHRSTQPRIYDDDETRVYLNKLLKEWT